MDAERARELLAQERERIERTLAGLAHTDTGEEADELDAGLAEGLRQELEAVERAEARLDAGTYGVSIESGEPIPDERLEALPTAERTAEEEARRN